MLLQFYYHLDFKDLCVGEFKCETKTETERIANQIPVVMELLMHRKGFILNRGELLVDNQVQFLSSSGKI